MSDLSYLHAFRAVFAREITSAWRKPAQVLQPVFFFLLVIMLFPLGISPAPQTLTLIGPGVIWIAALLAIMLTVDNLFKQDYLDGTIEIWLTSSIPVSLVILAKLIAAWLLSCSILIFITPVLALLLNIPTELIGTIMLSLLVGTPSLLFVGAIGNALTVGLNQGGVLLSLLVLPLYIPILIFATAMIEAASLNASIAGHIAMLASLLLFSILLAPLAIAASLRNSVN